MKAHDTLFDPLTQQAMTRRIFEEPGPHIERVDAFSAPHGFLFGYQSGMGGSPDHLSLAQSYMEAAYVLTEALNGDWEDCRVAEPLMYLYRHATELFLKGVMISPGSPMNSHHSLKNSMVVGCLNGCREY
jgi:hypothetical protein